MVAGVDSLARMVVANVKQRGIYRSDVLAFTKRMFPGYIVASHHREIALALQSIATGEIDRLIITMPPRHGKSELASIHFPTWYLANHPDRRIIACSNTQTLADRFSRQSRNKFSDPRWPFPDVRIASDLGQVQRWDIDGYRGGYIAAGVGSSITGFGADLILIDDPVKSAAEADSETYRENTWEWYQGTLRTRLEPNGAIVVVGTRWHEDDLIGRLLASGEQWSVLHLPAISDDGKALWPGRYDLDALERIQREVGSRNFDAQYQGRPVALEGGILKRHWFNTFAVRPYEAAIIQSWDTAFKDGVSNDYSVCSTIAYTRTGRYVLDVYQERLEFPDLERMVPQMYARWRPKAVLIEDKASGQSLIQKLKRDPMLPDGMNVIAIQVPNEKDWKIKRVNELAPMIEAGKVHFPEMATWLDATMHELTSFPLAAHDDIVDSILQGLRWIEMRLGDGGTWSGSWLPDDDDDDDRREGW